jgi:serine hydrolase
MSHVVIVHGWKSRPGSNWKPWVKSELEKSGIKVDIPEMPDSMDPEVNAWVDKIRDTVGKPTQQTYLVGHSLGCIAILKYLETLNGKEAVGAAIMVAGFGRKFETYQGQHPSFFDRDLDWVRIREHCRIFIAIASDNDENIKLDQAELFRQELGAKVVILHGMGHFASDDGVYELPTVRDELLALTR